VANFFKRFWNDDAGFLISAELLFLGTILVLGLIVGWTNLQQSVVNELTELGNAFNSLDQSYMYPTINSTCTTAGAAATSGSAASDSAHNLGWKTTAVTPNTIDQAPCP
jgi:hypothetical protein